MKRHTAPQRIVRFLLPESEISRFIGTKGEFIKYLRDDFNLKITIYPENPKREEYLRGSRSRLNPEEYFDIPEKCVTLQGEKPICGLLAAYESCDWPSISLLLSGIHYEISE